MKYRIGSGGFPVGPWLIPSGVVIDTDTVPDGWSKLLKDRGIMPPVNSQALDEATYDWLVATYGVNRCGVWPIPGQ
jgi:hypothetical protein